MTDDVTTPPLVLLAGPTATGKTAVAAELALRLGGEIVSADSMQVYEGCPIGTAQPTPEELRGVPCHLVGSVPPDQAWSVADWLDAAQARIAEMHGRGRAAIVAGGTGLYFKALTDGLFRAEGAGRHSEVRRRLEAEWDVDEGEALRARLEEIDPEAAERIHAHDRLRFVRALEVFEATGRPLSELQSEARARHRPPRAHRFVLHADRQALYERIDRRVEEMMERGLVDEVRSLLDRGATDDWPAMRALGYRQVARLIRGEISREDAVSQTQRLSRRYAKQQMILFRGWPGAKWLDVGEGVAATARAVEISLEFSPSD